jgi:phosphate butyryltransferase
MLPAFDRLLASALKLAPARVVIAAAEDPDAIEAIARAEAAGLAKGTLVGDSSKIGSMADRIGYQVDHKSIIHEPDRMRAVERSISLIRNGDGDMLMKGKVNTADLIRRILDRETGIRGPGLLSQVIVFAIPPGNRPMVMTDAAINIAPSLEQKADICRNAIFVAHAIGLQDPKCALLCAVEFVNPAMPATIDAAALTMMNRRGQISGAYLEGPIALDVPLSSFAADRKGITSPLVEQCDILVAPDIEAANILYRAICYMANGESGGIVVGASVPLVLLSRAEPPDTKLRSIAIAKLAAAHIEA